MTMFVLQLNPMTLYAKRVVPVVRAETEQELLDLLGRERVEPYVDEGGAHSWRKVFRKGGMLEWYNGPGEDMTAGAGVPAIYNMGTREEWAEAAAHQYDDALTKIPLASISE